MLQIKKMRADHVIDFAAEELKKYLQMMMPEEKIVDIIYEPNATDGFRLGLLEDFGLPNEAEDVRVDDVVHIDTEETGGILAGSNPRSVLFAVYRYLKLNGCRFFFPGAEGEHIPRKNVAPQKYHKLADHRYRGHSLEGDPSLEQVVNYIDWHAKEELNTFGCYNIFMYMRRYYNHRYNTANRPEEHMDFEVSETQWRALFECEAKKRGLRIDGGGHELLCKALGLNPNDRFLYKYEGKKLPEEAIPFLAEINGKRDLYKQDIFYTNVCMSNPVIRKRIVDQAIQRFTKNPHIDANGVSLGDGSKNHCECPECRKKRPSDWLVILLNELDEEMTKQGLENKVIFSLYVDTVFAPQEERFKNPDRFILDFSPITRSYTATIQSMDNLPEPIPYKRNDWEVPRTAEQLYSLLKAWQKVFPGNRFLFEYHFWIHQYRDPGLAAFSRRVYEDVMSYKPTGMMGCMQDGSNRSYFPHGFHCHIYAETLINRDLDYEAELEDYFSHFYGEDWKIAKDYLEQITEAFNHKFVANEMCDDPTKGSMYCPGHVDSLKMVKGITEKMQEIVKEHAMMPTRVQSAAWRLLLRHTEYCQGLAEVLIEKALGNDARAAEMLEEFFKEFGKYDFELERWLDIGLCYNSLFRIVTKKAAIEL